MTRVGGDRDGTERGRRPIGRERELQVTRHLVVAPAPPASDERVEASVRSDGSGQRRRAASRSLLALGFAAMIGWLDLVQASHGPAALAVFTLGLAGLALACWLWGYDSRDGSDWRTTSRR